MDSKKQDKVLETCTTLGERWKRHAILTIQKRISEPRWLRFVGDVQEKYAAPRTRFAAVEKRVQAEVQKQAHISDRERVFPPGADEETSLETDFETRELTPVVERSSHFVLDARLKNLLAGVLDIRIPAVKVYTNQVADALTRQQGADALTYQDKILFRAGKYVPRDPAGMALLGHELTHAAQAKMENKNTPEHLMTSVLQSQELEAMSNETRLLHHFPSPEPFQEHLGSPSRNFTGRPLARTQAGQPKAVSSSHDVGLPPAMQVRQPKAASSSRDVGSPPVMQVRQPKAASSSRDVGSPPDINVAPNSTPPLSEQDLDQIKHEVYRDLVNRIRIEFERGA